MCQSPQEIANNYIVIQELDDYIEENGDKKNTLIMRVLKQNMIASIQIHQDLKPISDHVRVCAESPSLVSQFKTNFLKTSGAVALIGFFMFMAFYTLVEVIGYSEALMVFK